MLHEAKKRTCQTASTSASEQMAVSLIFGISLNHMKTIEELITELLFADDCVFLTHMEEALQHIVNCFSDAAKSIGLTISLKKTEVLYQSPPWEAYSPPHISINDTNLNAVEHFTYLGSIISNDATVTKDMNNWLSKASSSFGRLSKTAWQSHLLCLSTKIQVYRAILVPTLLYDAETWTLCQKQIKLLEWFHQHCLRSILGIKWQDHMSNKEVLKKASLPSIEFTFLQVQLCWAGHITRMEYLHMPKAVFFSELQEGKCDHGASRKHYEDKLKRQLAQAEISHQS